MSFLSTWDPEEPLEWLLGAMMETVQAEWTLSRSDETTILWVSCELLGLSGPERGKLMLILERVSGRGISESAWQRLEQQLNLLARPVEGRRLVRAAGRLLLWASIYVGMSSQAIAPARRSILNRFGKLFLQRSDEIDGLLQEFRAYSEHRAQTPEAGRYVALELAVRVGADRFTPHYERLYQAYRFTNQLGPWGDFVRRRHQRVMAAYAALYQGEPATVNSDMLASRMLSILEDGRDRKPDRLHADYLNRYPDHPTERQIHETLLKDPRFIRTVSGRFGLKSAAAPLPAEPLRWKPAGPVEWILAWLLEIATADQALTEEERGAILRIFQLSFGYQAAEIEGLGVTLNAVKQRTVAAAIWDSFSSAFPPMFRNMLLVGAVYVSQADRGTHREEERALRRLATKLALAPELTGLLKHKIHEDDLELELTVSVSRTSLQAHCDMLCARYVPDTVEVFGPEAVRLAHSRLQVIGRRRSILGSERIEEREILTVREASKLFDVPGHQIRAAIRRKDLALVHDAPVMSIVKADLEAWLKGEPATEDPRDLLSLREAAELCDVKVNVLHEAIREGELTVWGSRPNCATLSSRRVERAQLLEWYAARCAAPLEHHTRNLQASTTRKSESATMLSVKQAGALLGIPSHRIYNAINRGDLPVDRSSDVILLSRQALENWAGRGLPFQPELITKKPVDRPAEELNLVRIREAAEPFDAQEAMITVKAAADEFDVSAGTLHQAIHEEQLAVHGLRENPGGVPSKLLSRAEVKRWSKLYRAELANPTPDPAGPQDLLTAQEAARRFAVSAALIYQARREGQLGVWSYRTLNSGLKVQLFAATEVAEWTRGRTQPTVPDSGSELAGRILEIINHNWINAGQETTAQLLLTVLPVTETPQAIIKGLAFLCENHLARKHKGGYVPSNVSQARNSMPTTNPSYEGGVDRGAPKLAEKTRQREVSTQPSQTRKPALAVELKKRVADTIIARWRSTGRPSAPDELREQHSVPHEELDLALRDLVADCTVALGAYGYIPLGVPKGRPGVGAGIRQPLNTSIAIQLHEEGHSPARIAESRGHSIDQVYAHLARAIEFGRIEAGDLIGHELADRVLTLFILQFAPKVPTPEALREALGDVTDWNLLKCAVAYLKRVSLRPPKAATAAGATPQLLPQSTEPAEIWPGKSADQEKEGLAEPESQKPAGVEPAPAVDLKQYLLNRIKVRSGAMASPLTAWELSAEGKASMKNIERALAELEAEGLIANGRLGYVLAGTRGSPRRTSAVAKVPPTVETTIRLHQKGLSPMQIAAARNLTINTVFAYLTVAIEAGLLDAGAVIGTELMERVKRLYSTQFGGQIPTLTALRDSLGGEVDWNELKCAVAHLKRASGPPALVEKPKPPSPPPVKSASTPAVEAPAWSELAWLLPRFIALSAPCSVAELRLKETEVETLRGWARSLDRKRVHRGLHSHNLLPGAGRWTEREACGALLLVLFSEVARREAREGTVWPCLEACFEPRTGAELFLGGQPLSVTKEAIEDAARKLKVRNVFGRAGSQQWYQTLFLQFGFPRHSIARLPAWLGQTGYPTEAIELLCVGPLRSGTFNAAWEQLRAYRAGKSHEPVVRNALRASPFFPEPWHAEILKAARSAPTGSVPTARPLRAGSFLSEPQMRGAGMVVDLVLQNLSLTQAGYDLEVNGELIGRLLRNSDATYSADPPSLTLDPKFSTVTVNLLGDDGQETHQEVLQLAPQAAPTAFYESLPVQAPQKTTAAVKVVCFAKHAARLGDSVQLSIAGLPLEATVEWGRAAGQELHFRKAGLGFEATFPITPETAHSPITVDFAYRHQGNYKRFQRSCAIPLLAASRLVEGQWMACQDLPQLTCREAREEAFRLVSPDGEAPWALVEGEVYSTRPKRQAGPLGELAGYGGQLLYRPGPYNSMEAGLCLAREVINRGRTGITGLAIAGRTFTMWLRRPLEAGPEHQLLWWNPGANALRVTAAEGEGNTWSGLVPPGIYDTRGLVVGLASEGGWLGSWWSDTALDLTSTGHVGQLAGLLRWFHLPLLAPSFRPRVRALATAHPLPCLEAWLLNRSLTADGATLKFEAETPEWLSAVRLLLEGWKVENALQARSFLTSLEKQGDLDGRGVLEKLISVSPFLATRILQASERPTEYLQAARESILGVAPGTPHWAFNERLDELAALASTEMGTDLGGMFARRLCERAVRDYTGHSPFRHLDRLNLGLACNIAPFRRLLTIYLLEALIKGQA